MIVQQTNYFITFTHHKCETNDFQWTMVSSWNQIMLTADIKSLNIVTMFIVT